MFGTVAALLDGTWRQALIERRDSQHADAAPFDALMIDLETMSTHSSRALLLSGAAVPFRLTPDGVEFGPPLLMVFELADQLVAGRRVDPGTQDFWGRQKPEASAHFLTPGYNRDGVEPIRCRVSDIADLVGGHAREHCIQRFEIYSQGIVFDVSNIADIILGLGQELPWKYWQVTDCRTLRRKLPKRRTAPKIPPHAAAHDPVHDCIVQAWALWEHATDEMLGVQQQAAA